MAKTKELSFKQRIMLTIIIASLAAIFVLALKIFEILPFVVLIIALVLILLFAGGAAFLFYLDERRRIIAIETKKRIEKEERERKLKELYELLGIEIVYNEDGSIKDLYQLLGIKKEQNNGVRVLTSYELLGVLPRFNELGIEIPNIVIIKNRINRLVKGIKEPLVLTYKAKAKENQADKKPEKKDTKAKPDAKKAKKQPLGQGYIKMGKGAKAAKSGKVDAMKVANVKAPEYKPSKVDKGDKKSQAPNKEDAKASSIDKSLNQEQDKKVAAPSVGKVVAHHGELNIDTQFIRIFKQKNLTAKSEKTAWFLNEEGMEK